ncbi:MAG: T9SS type A sorting domain-containing protein [Bacteroidota bacterium]
MKKITFFVLLCLSFCLGTALAQEEGCSINENVDATYCLEVIQGNGGFPLVGGVSAGVTTHEWAIVSVPPGANINDFTVAQPALLTTQVISANNDPGDFVAGEYVLVLRGFCIIEGETIEVSEPLTVTLTNPPVLTITQTGGQGSNGVYEACNEIFLTVNDDLPAGTTISNWTWTPFGNPFIQVQVQNPPNQVRVVVAPFPEICSEMPVELTYTAEGVDGCISEISMTVDFVATTTPVDPVSVFNNICRDNFRVNAPFPGCGITDYSVQLVSSTSATAPAGVPELVDGNLKSYFFSGFEQPGTYEYLFTATSAGVCNRTITKTWIFNILEDFQPSVFPDELYCAAMPSTLGPWDINDIMPSGSIPTDVEWIVNATPDDPIEGTYTGNVLTLNNVLSTTTTVTINAFVTDAVTGCRKNAFFSVHTANPITLETDLLRLDCGKPFEEFIKFSDYMRFNRNPFSSPWHFATVELTSHPVGYVPAWTTADWSQILGFFATDVGEYVFEITSTVKVDGEPPCELTETFTVVVGPGGELANAGTDFIPTCIEETTLIGNVPQDPSSVTVEWAQVDANPPVTFSSVNVHNPTISNLQNVVYTFSYTITSIFDPSCTSTDEVILDNTNCLCPDFTLNELWSPTPICYKRNDNSSEYAFRISLSTWQLDNFDNCATPEDIVISGTPLGPLSVSIVGGELVVEGLIELQDGEELCLTVPICIDGLRCPYELCYNEPLQDCEKECSDQGFGIDITNVSLTEVAGPFNDPDCPLVGQDYYNVDISVDVNLPAGCEGPYQAAIYPSDPGTGQLCEGFTNFPQDGSSGAFTFNYNSNWSAGSNRIFCFRVRLKKNFGDFSSCFETHCVLVDEFLMLRPEEEEEKGSDRSLESGSRMLDEVTMAPNPASNLLNLNNNNELNLSVTIFDASGRALIQNQLMAQSSTTLDISGLRNGVYFVSMIDPINGVQRVERLVVMKGRF